ncbi:Glutamate receptor [Melia azedarach]|uniref:Glutamate receptor n=1 Tax=Melia azedarach TaxID=155640 RepID=A0ACC1XVY1_MELAZ|nr:Glutamate receptor [Melia azedarach]
MDDSGEVPIISLATTAVRPAGSVILMQYIMFRQDALQLPLITFSGEREHQRHGFFDEHAEALTSESIKAAFFLSPYAKVFLMKYCKGFTLSRPIHKLGGCGFVFQNILH